MSIENIEEVAKRIDEKRFIKFVTQACESKNDEELEQMKTDIVNLIDSFKINRD